MNTKNYKAKKNVEFHSLWKPDTIWKKSIYELNFIEIEFCKNISGLEPIEGYFR